jgi:hypothetical protein
MTWCSVTIVRAGGLAGFVRRTELDSAGLPQDALLTLRALVAALLVDPAAGVAPAPDELRYELILEDDGATTTLRPTEQTLSDDERLLIAFVDGRDERVELVVPL